MTLIHSSKNCREILLLILILCGINSLHGASDYPRREKLINILVSNGFENVRIKDSLQWTIIAYENRVYRFDPEALAEILKIIIPEFKDSEKIVLVPQNRKIPLAAIEINVTDCLKYFNKEIPGKDFSRRLKIDFGADAVFNEILEEDPVNSSSLRFDIGFKPQLKFEFGPYNKPVLSQLNLVPGIKTNLWKGMNVNYELIIPLFNEFGNREDSVRPGIMAINQVIRFKDDIFISAAAGYFTQNRYGLDLEIRKYLYNGDLCFNFNIGTTSIASFSGMSRLYYYDAFKWTGSIGCEYRIGEYDLTVGLSAGKYLMGDESLRFDINREFGEIEVGFFAIRSRDGISNGGINLIIPLFPSHYWKPDFIRIKTDENFYWSYLVKTDSDQLIGLRYNTGNRLGVFNKKLNPSFIRNYFSKN